MLEGEKVDKALAMKEKEAMAKQRDQELESYAAELRCREEGMGTDGGHL